MRFTRFNVRRYRAFDAEVTVPLTDFTVLVGPNNLGKSTILRALNVFFGSFQRKRMMTSSRYERPDRYDVEHDYPKKYEGRRGRRWPTRMVADIEFTEQERDSYEELHGHVLPANVTVAIQYDVGEGGIIRVAPSSQQLQNTEDLIAFLSWFSENFRYVYIPATRNIVDFRRSVFSEIVAGAIRSTRQSRRRVDALEKFYSDIRNSVQKVAETLSGQLRGYLPNIETLEFIIDELDLLRFVSVRDVEIDDGAKTSLSQKGDGFKSLFALSMLQFIAQQRYGANLIFGIEEPESHLHSSAIYSVKASLRELSRDFQVLITTHSPILIQRDSIRDNIVVDQLPGEDFTCSARPARTLSQIRNSLGIRPQDNLTSAAVVVVVEGATEENCLAALMTHVNPELSEPVAGGQVRVQSAGGVTKIVTSLRALARDAASCVVVVDSDDEGLREKDKILQSGLISRSDLFQVPGRQGCRETEFEDVFDPEIYIGEVARACGIQVGINDFQQARVQSGNQMSRMAKWSDVMSSLADAHGKDWQDIVDEAKTVFGRAIASNTERIPTRSLPFVRSLAAQVLGYLREQ
jgi:putative ATP-dependent endonuclease of OLD family